jgi:catechol 2,3-dioxygenase-like lactoylglutathione lyase family enzyme
MSRFRVSLAAAACLVLASTASTVPAWSAEATPAEGPAESHMTGEVLPVFYVADVKASVELYRKLGFTFHHYWDYDAAAPVQEWSGEEPPVYAEMSAGPLTVAIHLGEELGDSEGKTRHYFRVDDVDAHHARLSERGIDVGEIHDLPWMRLFSVRDPDGHLLSFFTPPTDDDDTETDTDSS